MPYFEDMNLTNILRRVHDSFAQLMCRVTGETDYVNERVTPVYLEEVRADISMLKGFMGLQKSEREQEPPYIELIDKYAKIYCPSTFSDKFSYENQLEYLYLRVKIDDIPAKKDEFFPIV